MKTSIRRLILAASFAAFPASGLADVITLDDGSHLEGTLHRDGDNWILTSSDGKETHITGNRVKGITVSRGGKNDSASDVRDRLDSLRAVVEHLTNLDDIIARYQKFVALYPNSPIIDLVQKDLAMWQDRKDQGLVKLGSKWLTPADRDAARAASMDQARKARDLLAQSRAQDASALLSQALATDPANAAALYLQGVIEFQHDHFTEAGKSFNAVLALVPQHGPSLNNLGVLAWKQNAFVAAINDYDQAMQASPQNKIVLDNVAEAINALPADQVDSPVVKRTIEHFKDQDAALQQRAAPSGWYRWGATWVTTAQLDQLKAAKEKMQGRLDELQKDFDQTKQKILDLDSEAEEDQNRMHRMEADTQGTDAKGNPYNIPLPNSYFDLQRDLQQLQMRRQDLVRSLDKMRQKAIDIQHTLPIPQYSGLQKPIGIEGAPMPVIDTPNMPPSGSPMPPIPGPTTQPSP